MSRDFNTCYFNFNDFDACARILVDLGWVMENSIAGFLSVKIYKPFQCSQAVVNVAKLLLTPGEGTRIAHDHAVSLRVLLPER